MRMRDVGRMRRAVSHARAPGRAARFACALTAACTTAFRGTGAGAAGLLLLLILGASLAVAAGGVPLGRRPGARGVRAAVGALQPLPEPLAGREPPLPRLRWALKEHLKSVVSLQAMLRATTEGELS